MPHPDDDNPVAAATGRLHCNSKAMRFEFTASCRGSLPRSRLCRLMGVTDRELRAWKHRLPSPCQRRDMAMLAHIRYPHRLSLGSYGRPRMTEELNELGLRVGLRRVGRLMRQNGIRLPMSGMSIVHD